jgi:selenocysteine lyase/cysteine desulfurase
MLPCQRRLFDLPDDVAYLNCAYLSPLLKRAAAAGHAAVDRKLRPWEITDADFFEAPERLRRLFAELLGADADGVAIVPSASYGLSIAAANTPMAAGQRAIVLAQQYPSNVLPWRDLAQRHGGELVAIERPSQGGWTEPLLAEIDERTAVVALPNCHWIDGTLVDLVRVAARVREVGAVLALDLTQSLGALSFDLDAVRPDFVACAAYKWLIGPYSVGFLYAAPHRRDGAPLEPGYFVRNLDPWTVGIVGRRVTIEPQARRYDMAEAANFALLPIAEEGVRQIMEWGVAEVQASLRLRTDRMAARARSMGLEVAPDAERAGHYLGVRFPAGIPDAVMAALEANRVYVSRRGTSLRVTPHLYNTEADEDRLFAALAAAL